MGCQANRRQERIGGLRVEKYFDINEAGASVRCKLYCTDARSIERVIVCCHGFGGSKDSRGIQMFAQRAVTKRKGTAVVTFDWPCHGNDGRKNLLLEDCDLYLGIVCNYAREALGAEELYAYGTSFGGYLLLKYLSEHENPFRKVALRCPAVDMYDALMGIIDEDKRSKLAAGKTVLVGFDREVKVSSALLDGLRSADLRQRSFFDCADDLMVVHGTADEIVDYSSSVTFCDDNVIPLVTVEGADHIFHDPKKMDMAIARIIDFFGF